MKQIHASPEQFALFDEPPRLREVSDELGVIGARADQAEHREAAPEPDLPAVAISLADRAMAMSDILDFYAIQARAHGIQKIRTRSPGDNDFDVRYQYKSDDIHTEVDSKARRAEGQYWRAIDTLVGADAIQASAEKYTDDDIDLLRTTIKSELNSQFMTEQNKSAPKNREKTRRQLGINKKISKKAS